MTNAKTSSGELAAEGSKEALAQRELAFASATLDSIRSRVEATADLLQRRGEEKLRPLFFTHVQRQIWSLAGELLSVQERLVWVAEDLKGPPDPTARREDDDELRGSAELLATIHCVITDSLDPAIASLAAACRRAVTEEPEPT